MNIDHLNIAAHYREVMLGRMGNYTAFKKMYRAALENIKRNRLTTTKN